MSVSIRRPKIGIQDVVVAVLNEASDVVGGTPTYGAVSALAGAMKMTMKPNGTLASLYADDYIAYVANAVGKRQLSIELYDVLPSAYAQLLGLTLTNGMYVESSLDQSPWVALGYKEYLAGNDANGNKVFRYRWLLKGKFSKPDEGGETKKETINFQAMTLTAEFADLFSTKTYQTVIPRIDDPAVPASTLANFFAAPVLSVAADLTALSCVIAKSGTNISFTFTKGSAAVFNMNELTAVLENSIIIYDAGAIAPGSIAFTGEGTASVVGTFTPTVAFGANTVLAAVTPGVQDDNGIGCAAAIASLTFP